MLKTKRRKVNTDSNKKESFNQNYKHKSIGEKLKNVSKYASKDDEEILSSDDDVNLQFPDNTNDEDNEDLKNKSSKNSRKILSEKKSNETVDAKRLRIAKQLLNKIEDDVNINQKENLDEEVDRDMLVDQYIIDEIKKDNNDYFIEYSSLPNFNPTAGKLLKGHLSSVTAIDISSDSKQVISVSKDCRAIKWDLTTGQKVLLPEFSKKPLYACCYTPDNKYALFGGADKFIYQMDLNSGELVQTFKAHNDAITGIVFDENRDQYYTCSRDNTLKVWAVGTTRKSILIETFYGHIDKINDIDIMSGTFGEKTSANSNINRILTCGSDKQINLWKIDTQSFLQFKENENIISYDCIKSLNNDYYVSASYDGCLNLWRTNKKKALCKINNSHGFEKSVNLEHAFFSKDRENFSGSISNSNSNSLVNSAVSSLNVAFPILSLATIKNSDLIFSASSDGYLNIYKYTPSKNFTKEKIEIFKKLQLNDGTFVSGCINSMKVNKTNEFIVLAHGKDGRLGRWDCDKKAKNGISIVKLFDK